MYGHTFSIKTQIQCDARTPEKYGLQGVVSGRRKRNYMRRDLNTFTPATYGTHTLRIRTIGP